MTSSERPAWSVFALSPTDTWVRVLIVPCLAFIALATNRAYLADFWHHLARGKVIVETGAMLDRDIFTFTVAGKEFQDVNWLTQVFYYRLFEVGGLELVQVVNALTLAVTLGWLVVLCKRLCGSWSIAAAVGAATFFGLWQVLTIRPQTFSLLLFVMLFDFLHRAQTNRLWLASAPPILALWANVHGAFPAGIMLLGCFTLSIAWEELQGHRRNEGAVAAIRKLFVSPQCWLWTFVIVMSLAATLINPYGWRIYQYVGLTSNIAAVRRIDEWLPPSWDQWIGVAWFLSLPVLGGMVAVQRWMLGKWLAARDVILLCCFGFLAARSIRMVVWWLLVLGPVVAVIVARLTESRRKEEAAKPSWSAGVFVACLAAFVLTALPGLQHLNPLLASNPRTEDALAQIHDRLKLVPTNGRVFTRLEWGEYLGWAGHPTHKVFIDGRIEIYPDSTWKEYSDITTGQENWSRILDNYGVQALVLDPEYHARTGLLLRVESSPDWRRILDAGPARLYIRN